MLFKATFSQPDPASSLCGIPLVPGLYAGNKDQQYWYIGSLHRFIPQTLQPILLSMGPFSQGFVRASKVQE